MYNYADRRLVVDTIDRVSFNVADSFVKKRIVIIDVFFIFRIRTFRSIERVVNDYSSPSVVASRCVLLESRYLR